jgi:hypothetical protein
MKINRWMTLSLFLVLLTGCDFLGLQPTRTDVPLPPGVSEFSD